MSQGVYEKQQSCIFLTLNKKHPPKWQRQGNVSPWSEPIALMGRLPSFWGQVAVEMRVIYCKTSLSPDFWVKRRFNVPGLPSQQVSPSASSSQWARWALLNCKRAFNHSLDWIGFGMSHQVQDFGLLKWHHLWGENQWYQFEFFFLVVFCSTLSAC